MKHQTIHTKYHKLDGIPVVLDLNGHADGASYLDTPKVNGLLTELKSVPRYVLEPDIIDMMRNAKMQQSLATMIESNLARLPFPEVLVEYEEESEYTNNQGRLVVGKVRHFIYIAERTIKPFEATTDGYFMCACWKLAEFPGHVSFIAMSPFSASCDLMTPNKMGEMPPNTIIGKRVDTMRVGAAFRNVPALYLNRSRTPSKLIDQWLSNDAMVEHSLQPVVQAVCALIVVLRTKGVTQDRIEVPHVLNKTRLQSGKTIIQDHTVLRIGHVYDKSGNAHKYTGRTMPVHWRAGHWRNQAFGPGRTRHYDLFIEPMLINYVDGDKPVPRPKELRI